MCDLKCVTFTHLRSIMYQALCRAQGIHELIVQTVCLLKEPVWSQFFASAVRTIGHPLNICSQRFWLHILTCSVSFGNSPLSYPPQSLLKEEWYSCEVFIESPERHLYWPHSLEQGIKVIMSSKQTKIHRKEESGKGNIERVKKILKILYILEHLEGHTYAKE